MPEQTTRDATVMQAHASAKLISSNDLLVQASNVLEVAALLLAFFATVDGRSASGRHVHLTTTAVVARVRALRSGRRTE